VEHIPRSSVPSTFSEKQEQGLSESFVQACRVRPTPNVSILILSLKPFSLLIVSGSLPLGLLLVYVSLFCPPEFLYRNALLIHCFTARPFPWFHGRDGSSQPSSNKGTNKGPLPHRAGRELESMASSTGGFSFQVPAFLNSSLVSQFVNFRYMSLPYRVPFSQACGVFWTLYLSILNSE
jgi:hypothetical protein